MRHEFTARVKRMSVERKFNHYLAASKDSYTTILEIEGTLPIDMSRPLTITQEVPDA